MNKNLDIATAATIIFITLVQTGFAAHISVVPSHQTALKGKNFSVNISIDPEGSEVFGAQYELHFNNSLLNATAQDKGPFFGSGSDSAVLKNEINNTMGWLKYGETRTATPGITEPGVLATITFHAIDDIDGLSEIKFTVVKLSDPNVNPIPTNISNGSVEITDSQSGIAIFDTGAPDSPYPSIMGVHNGTIIPDQEIEVNRIYTYACPGTGGHTEYARIWGNGVNAHANWSGYTGNWHNLTFNTTFTLEPGKEYNYTIRTGSYPQIIHHPGEYNATGGKIACNEFIDANGKKYTGWIPAIKLWWEEE